MKTQLPSDGKDMQMAASEGFSKALSQEQKPKQEILVDIFGLCLILLGQWNTEVIDEWIKVFNQVVSILDWAVLKDKLADLVNQLSQSSQPKQSRYAAAKIIVAIAKVILKADVEQRKVHGRTHLQQSYSSLPGLREGSQNCDCFRGYSAHICCSGY